jgi:hypothetical protein
MSKSEDDEQLRQKLKTVESMLENEKRSHLATVERNQLEQDSLQSELFKLKKLFKDEHSNCNPLSHDTLSKLKTLQLTLEEQIEQNKKQSQQQFELQMTNKAQLEEYMTEKRTFKDEVREYRQQTKTIEHHNQELKEQIQILKNKLLQLQQQSQMNMNNNNNQHRASLSSMNNESENIDHRKNVELVKKYKKQLLLM